MNKQVRPNRTVTVPLPVQVPPPGRTPFGLTQLPLAELGLSAVDPRSLLGITGGEQRARAFSHVPFQQVGPTRLPEFHLPFQVGINPNLDRARRAVLTWSRRMGLSRPQPGDPVSGVWSEELLAGFDFALCAAGIDPDAAADELDLAAQWLTWGTYWDDVVPALFGSRRDYAGAKALAQRLRLFMPVELPQHPATAPSNALERGLADLWPRTAAAFDAEGRAEFRAAVTAMLDAGLWELADEIGHRVPDPVDYIEMRRATFGSELTMSLARLRTGRVVPAAAFKAGTVRSLENSAADSSCLMNDVFSYQKEIEFEGELHNGILVVQNFLNCDREAALHIVNDLMTSRMRQFEHVTATELPVLCDDLELDDAARRALRGYVTDLENWMAAILRWHARCQRYDEPALIRRYRSQPRIRSLGRSAAVLPAATSAPSSRPW
jgi:germacradienol/geosmin synthase